MPAVQVSLTLVLSIFVITVFIVFALRPTIISIATLKKTISESEETLTKLNTKISSLEQASVELESFKSALPALNVAIPNTGADYSSLTSVTESLAIQTQTSLESESLGPTLLYSRILSPFAPSTKQVVIELPFSARIVGTYSDAIAYLERLITMERIVSIDSVTLTNETGTGADAKPGVALNLSGNAYYLADKDQLDSVINKNKREAASERKEQDGE